MQDTRFAGGTSLQRCSRVFFSKPPKPLSTQPTTFLPQNNSKWIFEHMQWDHQNSAHILNIQSPNPFFRTSSPTKPHSPTPGGNSQINRLPCQTQKKTSVSPWLCPYGKISETIFQSIRTTKGPKRSNRASELVGLDNLNKNQAWFLQRPKYRFSNIETCPKGPNDRYAKIFRQSPRWAKSPRSRIKILISEYY